MYFKTDRRALARRLFEEMPNRNVAAWNAVMTRPVRLTYQPPDSSTFLSQQTSHQQPANSNLLSEQTSTSHQPPA
jgi:hypothetical protein